MQIGSGLMIRREQNGGEESTPGEGEEMTRRRRGDRAGTRPELMIAGDEARRGSPAGLVKALQG